MNLEERALNDKLDALDAEREARAWEADMRSEALVATHTGGRRMRMGRWLPSCSPGARYCPHNPACPR